MRECASKVFQLMEIRSTHTGANERKPKERKEQKYQCKSADKCACPKGTVRLGDAGMIAVSTFDHYRSGTQIPPQNSSFANFCSLGRGRRWDSSRRWGCSRRCARGGTRLLKFCDCHLPPIFIGGRYDLGRRRGRDVKGRGCNYWDRRIFFVARGCGRWLSHVKK